MILFDELPCHIRLSPDDWNWETTGIIETVPLTGLPTRGGCCALGRIAMSLKSIHVLQTILSSQFFSEVVAHLQHTWNHKNVTLKSGTWGKRMWNT